jgi:hypothetical protein
VDPTTPRSPGSKRPFRANETHAASELGHRRTTTRMVRATLRSVWPASAAHHVLFSKTSTRTSSRYRFSQARACESPVSCRLHGLQPASAGSCLRSSAFSSEPKVPRTGPLTLRHSPVVAHPCEWLVTSSSRQLPTCSREKTCLPLSEVPSTGRCLAANVTLKRARFAATCVGFRSGALTGLALALLTESNRRLPASAA